MHKILILNNIKSKTEDAYTLISKEIYVMILILIISIKILII